MATLATHELYTCTYKNKNKQNKQTKWEGIVHMSESHSCSVIFLKA